MSDPKTGVFMVGDFVHRMGDVVLTTHGRVTEVVGGRDGGPGRCRVRALTGAAHDWYETTVLTVTFRPAFPEGTRVTFADERDQTRPGTVHKILPDSEFYAVLPDDHDPSRNLSGQYYYRRADALKAAPVPVSVPVVSSPPPPAWTPRFRAGDRVTYVQPVNDRLEVVAGTVHVTPGNARDCYGVVPLGGDYDAMVWLGQDDLTPAPAAAPEPPPHAGPPGWVPKFKAGDGLWHTGLRRVVTVTAVVAAPDQSPTYRVAVGDHANDYCAESVLVPPTDPAFPIGSAVLLPDGRRATVTWAPRGPGAAYTVDPGGGLGTRDVGAADLRAAPTPRSVLAARPPDAVFLRYVESDGNAGVVIPTGVVAADDTGEDLLAGILVHLDKDHTYGDTVTPAGWQFTRWYMWSADLDAATWVAADADDGFYARLDGLVYLGRLLLYRRDWEATAAAPFAGVPPVGPPGEP